MGRVGAYLLHVELFSRLCLKAGALGEVRFPAGRYIYVGSAARGIDARVARHRQLAEKKTGRLHWHIDYLLVQQEVRLTRVESHPGAKECVLSQRIARRRGSSVPVPGFGSSDCRSGCRTHLYRMA